MLDTNSILFRLSGDIILVCDGTGKIHAASPAVERHLSLKPNDLVGHAIWPHIRLVSVEPVKKLFENASTSNESFPLEFVRADKQHVIARCRVERDQETKLFILVCTPFTQMDSDAQLRWRLALESTTAGYWGRDVTADVMYFSKQLEIMLGYEPGELNPTMETFRSLVAPEDRDGVASESERFSTLTEGSYRLELRFVKKDGTRMWVLSMGVRALDDAGHIISNGWIIDIDDRKRAEQKLQETEEKSRALLASLPDIFFIYDRDGRYVEVHATKEENLLFPPHKLIGKKIDELIEPALAKKSLEAIQAAIDFGTKTSFEYELDLPIGHAFFEARVVPNYGGKTALVIIRDITESRTAQLAKAESDKRLRGFIENCPAAVYNMRITPDGEARYTYVGGRIEEMFEKKASDLIGYTLFDIQTPYIHPDDVANADATLKEAIAKNEGFRWTGRYVLTSGKILYVNSIGTTQRAPDGSILISALTWDITPERLLLQKVQEQQAIMTSSARLTALGEMAGGIAHEINNPLTVAHAHATRLRDLANSGKELDRSAILKAAEKIEAVCMRISRIIAGLRSIARDGENDRFNIVPLEPIVNDALSLCSEKLRHHGIELSVSKISPALSLECRSVQISQILVNLLLNAEHAVASNPFSTRWVKLDVVDAQSFIEIRVSDSGILVPAEIQEKIFDPFFTTKEVGQGTGLGLSVSASIATAHGGSLFLDTLQPHTTFVLRLPKRQS